jgi:hypothetical protein
LAEVVVILGNIERLPRRIVQLAEMLFVRSCSQGFLLASVDDRRQFGTVQPANIEAMLTWILIFAEIFVHSKIIG